MIHPSKVWVDYFSAQPRSMLDVLATDGWITKTGNKYHIVLLDSAFYSNVAWHQLDIDVPIYGTKWFAFDGEEPVEPTVFYCKELEIKFTGPNKKIKETPFPAMSNDGNVDLESFFSNGKVWKSKAHRKTKLREKKIKRKALGKAANK